MYNDSKKIAHIKHCYSKPFILLTMYQLLNFYHFTIISSPEEAKIDLLKELKNLGLLGTIYLAEEGINGAIAGKKEDVAQFLSFFSLYQDSLSNMLIKQSFIHYIPFDRLRLKVKKEIVSLRYNLLQFKTGQYVEANQWNNLITASDDIIHLDVRNKYEVNIGKFKGAESLDIDRFSDFPKKFDAKFLSAPRTTKFALYCTGGIRCEKATAYIRELGFNHVYHLKGGILAYIDQMKQAASLWEGECFVFDARISVKQGTSSSGTHIQCFTCRYPIPAAWVKDKRYQAGISCPFCFDSSNNKDK